MKPKAKPNLPSAHEQRRVLRINLLQILDESLKQGHTREEILLAVNTRISEHESKAS